MKATSLLKKQHREAKSLFVALKKESKRGADSTAEELVKSLLCHMLIEEEIFYPAVKALDDDLVLEAYEEHATARFAMRRLTATEGGDEHFEARVTTLRELIDHHVEEEEEDLFPRVEKKMDEDELDTLGDTMKARFEELMGEELEGLFEKMEALSPQPTRAAA